MLLLSLLNGFQYIFSLGHPSWKCCYFEVAWKTSYYLLQLFQDFKIVMYIFPSSIYYPVGFLFVCFFFPPPPGATCISDLQIKCSALLHATFLGGEDL